MLWSGFVIGLLGSLHCVGMCGPIVAALPAAGSSRLGFLAGRLLYNLGRVISYALMGIVFGLVGKGFFVAGYQQALSIALGVILLLVILTPSSISQQLIGKLGMGKLYARISSQWGKLFRSQKKSSLLLIGVLNGFLPCGFVYVGLAGAVAMGGAIQGSVYMMLFGLGTIPILLAFSFVGNLVGQGMRRAFARVLPALAVALALLFILRGLSLGIPFVSPEMTHNEATGQVESSCCKQHQVETDSSRK